MTNPRPSRLRTVLLVCASLFLVLLLTAGTAWWWLNRPLVPTTLTTSEQNVLEQKIELVQSAPAVAPYRPGTKTLILTERELNGWLGLNDLGEQFRLDLANDAIHARLNTTIPNDALFLAGRTVKAKARFLIADVGGRPSIVLDDLSVWGISLPNAWLGQVKGENLLELVADELGSSPLAQGITSFKIAPGALELQLAE